MKRARQHSLPEARGDKMAKLGVLTLHDDASGKEARVDGLKAGA